MRQERSDHTLQATALVHELFLRLVDQREVNWQNRDHFYGTASQVMRRVLVDHARKKQAAKRGGAGQIKLETPLTSLSPDSEVLAVDQALRKLESIDARKAQVVERKYFGGMTTEETADSLAVSVATVERDWTMAKAWLFRELRGPSPQS
jgi:RNA polymerase sigma factor (TIGR02999 family)